MEMEPGKLFIGGISWETNEGRLREYFQAFGEVVEAFVMRDRATGRSRGFGFVVFANASAAEEVVKERHIINGRTVEAKKAVPRDDHQNSNRNTSSMQGESPSPARAKKIFVGGLASTVTESDFKAYFEQFGMITDVVVMYDHNTKRPRGFGFITYDSEEAVDRVLVKTFHELSGKAVEVKRAVPKELSPGPKRNNGLNRANGFLNAYSQRYIMHSPGGYGTRTDDRFSPVPVGRNGYLSHNLSNQSIGSTLDAALGLNYSLIGDPGLRYGHKMNSYFSGNSAHYDSPVSYDENGYSARTTNRNLWENENPNYSTASLTVNDFVSSRIGNTGSFGRIGDLWYRSSVSSKVDSLSSSDNVYGQGNASIIGRVGYARNNVGTVGGTPSLYTSSKNVLDRSIENLCGNDSFYSSHAWHSSYEELEDIVLDGYRHGNAAPDIMTDDPFGNAARSHKGIAA